MKFAICNETFQNQSFRDACECAAKYGYDGVEIAPFTFEKSVTEISAQEREEIKKTAVDNGLDVVGIHWCLLEPKGLGRKLNINCADDSTRAFTIGYYQELMRFCADVGGNVMVHGSPKQRNWEPTDFYQDVFNRSVEFFKACMNTASEYGVTVCFEPLTHTETNFINCARDAQVLIDAVDHPNFKLHLDAKAMCGGEYDPPADVIRNYKHVIRHFHANDRNLKGPGTGDVDFVPIAAALKEIDYQGYVSVEVFDYTPDAETITRESMAYLKKVF